MFKKTTKTNKDLARSSRNAWIRTHVNSTESLMVFLSSLTDSSSKYLVRGRSPISLIAPLFGGQNRKSSYWMVYDRFRETKLTIESRGIRIWFKNSFYAKFVLKVLATLFRVSPIKLTNDPTYVYSAVVSIGEPSIEVTTDISLENKVRGLMEEIEGYRANNRLYDDKIRLLKEEYTELGSQIMKFTQVQFDNNSKIRKIQENIRELKGV